VRPQVYTAHRAILHRNPLLVIYGILQVVGEVLNVVANAIHPLSSLIAEEASETRIELAKQQRMYR
jgi:hypothetical protein